MTDLSLCLNCLEAGATTGVEVGPDRGSQRDPWRQKVILCERCREALLDGDFGTLAERFREKREISR